MTSATTDILPREGRAAPVLKVLTSIEVRILLPLLAVLAVWGLAIATFGYPALIVPVLALVPSMFVVLMLITVGR